MLQQIDYILLSQIRTFIKLFLKLMMVDNYIYHLIN